MKHLLSFFKEFKQTGAIAPSSRFLARGMVQELNKHTGTGNPPLNILEIGAGAGPMTEEIINSMRPADRFDVIEIHRDFFEHLSRKYRQENVHIHHDDILKFDTGSSYDFIISSLPYENIPGETSRSIWEKQLSLCKDGGYITYFKYLKPGTFKNRNERELVDRYLDRRETVWLNLPPARVYTLRIESSPEDRRAGKPAAAGD